MMPAAPTTRTSLEKSPLRRNEITRNVTKNMIAVPKSPIIARQPRQNTEKPMNMVKFFFCWSSSSVAAPTNMNTIFTISEGWNEKPPIWIQFLDPFLTVPISRFNTRSSTAAPIRKYIIFLVLFRSLRYQHSPKNNATPKHTHIACLNSLPGYADAVTARLRVERKNAIISISKPTLLNMRITMTYTHMRTMISPNAIGSEGGKSSPSATLNWMTVIT